MKRLLVFIVILAFVTEAFAQIAVFTPECGIAQGSNSTNIIIESEQTVVDLTRDSATVTCTYTLHNKGVKTTIQMAFPHKYFQYNPRTYRSYARHIQNDYHISVNDAILGNKDLYFPPVLDSLINCFIAFNKKSSTEVQLRLYSELDRLEMLIEGNAPENAIYAPWYVWSESFNEKEEKVIVIKYSVPNLKITTSAVGHEYFFISRAIRYPLSVTHGWNESEKNTSIIVNIKDDRVIGALEQIYPSNYTLSSDSSCIQWHFDNQVPSQETEIYLQFCNKKQYPVWSPEYDPYDEDNY